MATTSSSSSSSLLQTLETNPRGIPKIQFVENVGEFIKSNSSSTIEVILGKLQETVSLESRLPEIKKALETDSDEPIKTTFELCDTLWVPAKVKSTKTINLWLGANVMVEYSLEEGKKLLNGNLTKAENSLKYLLEDLEFLREQITTME
ncbi:6980_t:CDS:2, partial [Entrophospora sp. SA101]